MTKATRPLWEGPLKDGVTQSLLGRWLVCRERFRLLVVHGLKPAATFTHRMEYGSMWHVCEEHADGDWQKALEGYCLQLCAKHRSQQEQIDHWYNVCKVQWPIYVDYWRKHPFVKDAKPVANEQVFDVTYPLPSGRSVRLRGKWDGLYAVGKGNRRRLYLYEHKCKGEPLEDQIQRQLHFDMQTMFYMVALNTYVNGAKAGDKLLPIDYGQPAGVLYNVVRRPLSGGKGTIKQHKPSRSNPAGESKTDFYARVAEYIRNEPEHYFMRWQVQVIAGDIARFEQRFLIPALESLCDWWHAMQACSYDPWSGAICTSFRQIHWQHPYGVWNSLNEGGSSELDEYLATGSELGLQRTNTLFSELA